MEKNVFELMKLQNKQNELKLLMDYNDKTVDFGVELSRKDAEVLMLYRNETLKKYNRVEFGKGILDKLIFAFCDSQYIFQDDYLETLIELQDIFYEFKNESNDQMADDELIAFMREQFENVCMGDLEYLESTVLKEFVDDISKGYKHYE